MLHNDHVADAKEEVLFRFPVLHQRMDAWADILSWRYMARKLWLPYRRIHYFFMNVLFVLFLVDIICVCLITSQWSDEK